MARPGLCRIGLHKWGVRRDPDVRPYVACQRCMKAKTLDTRPESLAGGAFGEMLSPYGRDPG